MDLAFEHFRKIISLNEEEKGTFQDLVEIVSYPKKEMVLTKGQVCRYEYFVLSGCLRTFYFDENFHEHTTMFAPEGWWTGNLKSFVRELPSDYFVESVEASTLLRLNKQAMEKLFSRVPKFERYFRILLQNRLLATQERLNNHLSSPAKERYHQFLSAYPDLMHRVPLKHIASYLGITPTYLSRLRARR